MTFSNQCQFPRFFSPRKMTYRSLDNSGLRQAGIACLRKMTLVSPPSSNGWTIPLMAVAEFIEPFLGYKVNSGIGLHGRAGRAYAGVDFITTQRSMNSATAFSHMDVVLSFIKENQRGVQDSSSSFFSFKIGLVYCVYTTYTSFNVAHSQLQSHPRHPPLPNFLLKHTEHIWW